MGEASIRKWVRRVKFALDHCPCGLPLVVDLRSRFRRCPTHGSVLPSRRHPGETMGEAEHLDLSAPQALNAAAVVARAAHRSRRWVARQTRPRQGRAP